MSKVRVVYTMVRARDVFNLTSPRWLPEVSRDWHGFLPWHNPQYDELRDYLEARYIEEFDKAAGHYRELEKSILKEGFRNPVMLTSGKLLRRSFLELPADVRKEIKTRMFCEYNGGSRLLIAAKHDLELPALVNDFANLFPNKTAVPYASDMHLNFYREKPKVHHWDSDGSLYCNYLKPSHLAKPIKQKSIRDNIIFNLKKEVAAWLKEHDKDENGASYPSGLQNREGSALARVRRGLRQGNLQDGKRP